MLVVCASCVCGDMAMRPINYPICMFYLEMGVFSGCFTRGLSFHTKETVMAKTVTKNLPFFLDKIKYRLKSNFKFFHLLARTSNRLLYTVP